MVLMGGQDCRRGDVARACGLAHGAPGDVEDVAPIPLCDRTLHRYAAGVAVPRYDRRALVPAVVHLSVGYFHRSHQAVYLDALARRGHTGWGLTGVGLRRRDMGDALLAQDGLYTVVERGPRGDRPRVIGAMGRYLFAPDDPARVVRA